MKTQKGTEQEIRKRFGDRVIPLFKTTYPLTPKGNGYEGVVLYDQDADKVLCYECLRWFDNLSLHYFRKHKDEPKNYKTKYSMRTQTPLVSKGFHDRASMHLSEALKRAHKDPSFERKIKIAVRKSLANRKEHNIKRINAITESMRSTEFKNRYALCDAQIRERLNIIRQKNPKVNGNTIKKQDWALYSHLIRKYGSVYKASRELNFQYRDHNKYLQ